MNLKIKALMEKGVKINCPESIEIGEEVDIERISGKGVSIYTGSKIFGASTFISKNCIVGYEAPAVIENCQLDSEVDLRGGYFNGAVFLNKVKAGSGSHVREGSILEEESKIAHTVGLKQTILFPFVTLGSLINFCDCLIAGGTSRKNHSEVGSSFIHFNYTPNQDKATPSIMGDVPSGVMLNKNSIFLGGQGGIVGPARLPFGTVTAAGSIVRNDELNEDLLILSGENTKNLSIPYNFKIYQNVTRIMKNNMNYIGNLIALENWYNNIRGLFVSEDFAEEVWEGLKEKIGMAIDERIKRFIEFADKMPQSIEEFIRQTKKDRSFPLIKQKEKLFEKREELKEFFVNIRKEDKESSDKEYFIKAIQNGIKELGKDYISVIKNLSVEDRSYGVSWLKDILENIVSGSLGIIEVR